MSPLFITFGHREFALATERLSVILHRTFCKGLEFATFAQALRVVTTANAFAIDEDSRYCARASDLAHDVLNRFRDLRRLAVKLDELVPHTIFLQDTFGLGTERARRFREHHDWGTSHHFAHLRKQVRVLDRRAGDGASWPSARYSSTAPPTPPLLRNGRDGACHGRKGRASQAARSTGGQIFNGRTWR
jgi:hypothetical protein